MQYYHRKFSALIREKHLLCLAAGISLFLIVFCFRADATEYKETANTISQLSNYESFTTLSSDSNFRVSGKVIDKAIGLCRGKQNIDELWIEKIGTRPLYKIRLTSYGADPDIQYVTSYVGTIEKSAGNTTLTISDIPASQNAVKLSASGLTPVSGSDYKAVHFSQIEVIYRETFRVTYDANGGSGAPVDSTEYDSGTSATLKSGSGMYYSGKTFDGWNTNAAGTGTSYAAGGQTVINGDLKLYAKWTEGSVTPEAPTGLSAVAPTTQGGKDGKITGVNFTMEYSVNGGSTWQSITGTTITGLSAGQVLVRVKANGSTPAGKIAYITVPEGSSSPAAPTGLTAVAPTTEGGTDGKITGVNSTMEYSVNSGSTWKSVTGTTITGLSAGSVLVRVKANGSTPAGKLTVVTVPEWEGGTSSYSSSGSYIYDTKPERTGTPDNPVTNGTWTWQPDGKWTYATNAKFKNTWGYLYNPYGKTLEQKFGWFYFDASGIMMTGWQLIDGKWYYLNPVSDGTQGKCYIDTITPDGYRVGKDGAWVGK